MATAVQTAPGMDPRYDNYSNGMSVMEDSEDGEHDYVEQEITEEDMEQYYSQHYHPQMQHEQLQYHHYQPGDDEAELEEDEVYSDDSSDESVLPDENIDFSLIYALHTFLATVEGQASVVKGDSLLLLDDTNSYWWLVRVLKTEDVGYIPAENVETPYERLARLNKHRNVDIAAPTKEESSAEPPRSGSKLKSLMVWKTRTVTSGPDGEEVVEREGRRVIFAPPTYVEHPGQTWSSDEEGDSENEDQQMEDAQEHLEETIDNSLDDDGYEVEPDDGVEWAQDAVEAIRSAGGPGVETADPDLSRDSIVESEQSHTKGLGVGAGVAAAAAAAAGAAVSHHPPAPNRSPSPAAPSGALARTNPTPPPHRAGISPNFDDSGEYNSMREISETPPPSNSNRAGTPASSDVHTPSTPQPYSAPTLSPKVAARALNSGSTTATPTTVPAAAAAAASAPSPKPRAPSPRRAPQWQVDAFDISRLSKLVRMRAEDERRTRRVPKVTEMDDVQRIYYGEKLALDALQPDIRAGYVHLQAKMDSFDREIDKLLGTLVAAR